MFVKPIDKLMNRFNILSLALVALFASSVLPLVTFAAPPVDFTVESPADGRTFKLSEVRGKYVALHFLLKTECPFCIKHTRDYAKKSTATPDVVHILLKPDGADEIKAWSTKANRGDDFADVTIYRDPEAADPAHRMRRTINPFLRTLPNLTRRYFEGFVAGFVVGPPVEPSRMYRISAVAVAGV
jgi:thiol-disulfide isomerase/thioredoxin